MLSSASGIARRLDHGWVGTEHFLLALLAEPSVATEALADVGVTYDRVLDALRGPTGLLGPDVQHYSPERGLSPSPAAYKLEGRAGGLALARGYHPPEPEHWLLAMVYEEHGLAGALFRHLGASPAAILDALRRRGARVPDVDPPVHRPMRGHRRVEIDEAELQPMIDLLVQRHPPGSEWRWGFNWLAGEPRRARVDSEDGIDLDGILAEVRRGAAP
jgi:ATP-dependent Clp protease ATP-binding subunit ClpA